MFTKQVRFKLTHIVEYSWLDTTWNRLLTQIATPSMKFFFFFFVMIELVAHMLIHTHRCAKTKIMRWKHDFQLKIMYSTHNFSFFLYMCVFVCNSKLVCIINIAFIFGGEVVHNFLLLFFKLTNFFLYIWKMSKYLQFDMFLVKSNEIIMITNIK